MAKRERALFFPSNVTAEDEVPKLVEALRLLLPGVEVISTYDDKRAKEHLSWDDWCTDVVNRVDMASRKPWFSHFILQEGTVGRGTFLVGRNLWQAKKGKMVQVYNGSTLLPCKGIRCLDEKDWKSGWRVEAKGLSVQETPPTLTGVGLGALVSR